MVAPGLQGNQARCPGLAEHCMQEADLIVGLFSQQRKEGTTVGGALFRNTAAKWGPGLHPTGWLSLYPTPQFTCTNWGLPVWQ